MQCVLNLFQKLIAGLKLLGHKMQRYNDRGSIVCAIAKNQTGIFANADYRKAGEVVGLWLDRQTQSQLQTQIKLNQSL